MEGSWKMRRRWRQRAFRCGCFDEDAEGQDDGFTHVRQQEAAHACSGRRVDALGTGSLDLEINWGALGRRWPAVMSL
jgi:hypothetical protein